MASLQVQLNKWKKILYTKIILSLLSYVYYLQLYTEINCDHVYTTIDRETNYLKEF